MNKFRTDLQDANDLHKCTNHFGSFGRSFKANDLDNINLFVEALKAVKGVEDIEISNPNEYDVVMIWATPTTNISYAICRAICDNFVEI